MIQLPRHLSRWAAQLALFPEELALALGASVWQLSNLLGGGWLPEATEGDPDGYDGIARRGSYDRLLPAEWLMLDEAPEEFLRRAIAGEHSFLERAYRGGATERRCIALFDAGFDQLGAPRIAHLALAILLSRRAEEQKARFEWGILQDPERVLHAGFAVSSVMDLLGARYSRRVSAADVDRWAAELPAAKHSELWLIGSNAVASEAARHQSAAVTISDVIEPEPPQRLHICARAAGSARSKEALLEVPPRRLAIQLLRDPFTAAVAPPVASPELHPDVHSDLIFSPDSRRLYVRGADQTLISYKVPNSPRGTPGPPVVVRAPEGHAILGVGRAASKRVFLLSRDESAFFLHALSKRGATITESRRFDLPGDAALTPPNSTDLLPVVVYGAETCFVASDGYLLTPSAGTSHADLGTGAHGSTVVADCLVWVSIERGVPRITWRQADSGWPQSRPATLPPDLPPIFDARSFFFGKGVAESFAYATAHDSWLLVQQRRCTPLRVASGVSVAGVLEQGFPPQAGLLTLDETRTRLELLPSSGPSRALLTTAAPVTRVEVSRTGREIAFVTSTGEVGVYSSACDAMVLRASGGGEP